MKFRRTPSFYDDFGGLESRDQQAVKDAFPDVARALQGDVELFNRFRIKRMKGHPEIWEGHVRGNSLCFTFQYEYTTDGEKVCFFRKVGTHDIYSNP
ncbi:MAG: hypothetical protein H8D87_00120 [Deltaproteobacteria bacterium]|nr:hypothetical protein [Candidatus Desulfobacula maris]